ncbi:hypothetical protein Amsp01_105050 [Amycolatopsis sp. NBRC 101858]|nr:hypothetical protein Amsp01_105050 [Amycolatopsis sp. NBRC 101858]
MRSAQLNPATGNVSPAAAIGCGAGQGNPRGDRRPAADHDGHGPRDVRTLIEIPSPAWRFDTADTDGPGSGLISTDPTHPIG